MSRSQRAAFAAWILASCGGSEIGPVHVLLPGDVRCARWPSQLDLAQPAEDIVVRAHRQRIELNFSFATQEAALLTRPILDDPDAERWKIQTDEVRIEGAVLAGGEDWSVVKMVAFSRMQSIEAEIDVTPDRTTYALGERRLEVRPYYVATDQLVFGCDPDAGVAFERIRFIDVEGNRRQVDRCFENSSHADRALTAGRPHGDGGPVGIPGRRLRIVECGGVVGRAELGL